MRIHQTRNDNTTFTTKALDRIRQIRRAALPPRENESFRLQSIARHHGECDEQRPSGEVARRLDSCFHAPALLGLFSHSITDRDRS